MSFLDKLGLSIISNEKEMLKSLRNASEEWFNELTEPFFFVLNSDYNSSSLTNSERERLSKLADKMLREEVMVNYGNKVENKLSELKLSNGIPFFSARKELLDRIKSYLESGIFLKKFVYGGFKSNKTKDIQQGIENAQLQWSIFKKEKDALVNQINNQLSKIG